MTLPYMKFQQPPGMSSLLKKELDPDMCRGVGTLLAGSGAVRKLELGQFVGKLSGGGTVTVTPTIGTNTGNGVLTVAAAPAYTSAVKPGRYTVTYMVEKTNAGDFEVEDPLGVTVGVGKTGVAFGKQIKFTIADGSTDFVAGDQFFIDVAIADGVNDGKLVAWDPTATNGSQIIHGVCLKACEAPDGSDLPGGVLYARRLSLLNAASLVWPVAVSDANKAIALADITDRLGLIART